DFDAFWAAVKAEAGAADLSQAFFAPAPDAVAAKFPGREVAAFRVPLGEGKAPATGWVSWPRDAEPGSLPALLFFHGYGMGGQTPDQSLAAENCLWLDVNAHGFDLAAAREYYAAFSGRISDGGTGGGYGFRDAENESPQTCYFRAMVVRDLVAARFARTLPQWNGRDMTARGFSQGGFQAVAVGELDHAFGTVQVHAPWLCDIGGEPLRGRRPGGWKPRYKPALRYFDTVFFARRLPETDTFEVLSQGLADGTCPPSGTAAAYNAVRGPKSGLWIQNRAHSDGPVPEGVQTQRTEGAFAK
ncbi:MAG: acetylxylan esterase, partial [Kiritimatiellae bacterium]|nr:acetylxylan esterase [Kiritimatiellia bacterium]